MPGGMVRLVACSRKDEALAPESGRLPKHAAALRADPKMSLLQIFQNFRRMGFGVGDRNPVFFHQSVGTDQGRRTNRPFDCLALGILPRAPRAVSLHRFDLRIGKKHEGQIKLGDKLIV